MSLEGDPIGRVIEWPKETMKIGMQTWGSQGDVFPFIALAAGLQSEGHDVTLAVTSPERESFSDLASKLGVHLIHVGNFVDPAQSAMREIARTSNGLKQIKLINKYFFDPAVNQMYDASQSLCAGNDIVIGHFWAHTLLTAATAQSVPRIVVHFCPIAVRSDYAPAGGPSLGPRLNGLIWELGDYLMRRQLFARANELRASAGLRPVKSLMKELFISDDLTLIATSSTLCLRAPDWGENIQICGYLTTPHPESSARMPDSMSRFIEAGEPPVYFTFGSCDAFFGPDNAKLFLETIELIGERAIIQCNDPGVFGDIDESRILVVDRADHTKVFPRCKLIVHHGGAGTTQTALYAGTPSIAVEHGFDQSYWGKALVNAGVSPRMLHRRSVTPAKLARAIRDGLQSPQLTTNARHFAEVLAKEDGVRNAVALISKYIRKSGTDPNSRRLG